MTDTERAVGKQDLCRPCDRCGAPIDVRQATPAAPVSCEWVSFNVSMYFDGLWQQLLNDFAVSGHGSTWYLCPDCGRSFGRWVAAKRPANKQAVLP